MSSGSKESPKNGNGRETAERDGRDEKGNPLRAKARLPAGEWERKIAECAGAAACADDPAWEPARWAAANGANVRMAERKRRRPQEFPAKFVLPEAVRGRGRHINPAMRENARMVSWPEALAAVGR